MLVKDSVLDVPGVPTAYGSPQIYPPRPATADAAMVALLRRASLEPAVEEVMRFGRREDVWWTYGYSPIDDADGVGGKAGA